MYPTAKLTQTPKAENRIRTFPVKISVPRHKQRNGRLKYYG